MPTYNAIQTDRVERLVGASLGVRNGGILPTVAPELTIAQLVPTLEDIVPLSGYFRWGSASYRSAVAAQYPYVYVSNFFTSQLVGVRFTVCPEVNNTIWLLTSDAVVTGGTLNGADTVSWLDTRRTRATFPLGAAAIQVGSNTTVNAPPGLGLGAQAVGIYNALANTPAPPMPWIVLRPLSSALVAMGTVNTTMVVSVEGWMRDILPDELVV